MDKLSRGLENSIPQSQLVIKEVDCNKNGQMYSIVEVCIIINKICTQILLRVIVDLLVHECFKIILELSEDMDDHGAEVSFLYICIQYPVYSCFHLHVECESSI